MKRLGHPPKRLRGAGIVVDTGYPSRAENALKESMRSLQCLVQASPMAIIAIDLDGKIRIWNTAAERLFGWAEDEVLGQDAPHISDVEQEDFRDLRARVLRGEQLRGVEAVRSRRDGSPVDVLVSGWPVYDSAGNVSGSVALFVDNTERVRAQKEAKRLNEDLERIVRERATLLEAAHQNLVDEVAERERVQEERDRFFSISRDVFCVVGFDGLIKQINPAVTELFGYGEADLTGKSFLEFVHPEDVPMAAAELQKVIGGAATVRVELRLLRKDGSYLWMGWTAAVDAARHVLYAAGRDITERKRRDTELLKLRRAVEASGEVIFLTDRDGLINYVNPEFTRLYGYQYDEVVGKTTPRVLKSGLLGHEVYQGFWQVLLSCQTLRGEIVNKTKDGRLLTIDGSASPICDEDGSIVGFLAIQRDITERKLAEERLRESEERLRLVVDHSPDTVFYQDRDLRYTFIAHPVPPFTEEQMQGKTDVDLLVGEEARRLMETKRKVIETGEGSMIEMPLVLGESTRYYEAAFEPRRNGGNEVVGIFGYVRDITERKRAEEADRRAFERLQKTLEGTIQAMAMTVEMKDPYTAGHQENVAQLAVAIGREMGLPEAQLEAVRLAGMIHDIGKIGIPAEILAKPGRMSETEFTLIKAHPQVGYDVLKNIEFPWPIAQSVRQHHERIDGSGYPLGLSGDEILLEAKVLAVADVVEAIASHRPYRPALGIDVALRYVSDNSGTLFDSAVVEACSRLFAGRGYKLDRSAT